jgi:hypothetical protein
LMRLKKYSLETFSMIVVKRNSEVVAVFNNDMSTIICRDDVLLRIIDKYRRDGVRQKTDSEGPHKNVKYVPIEQAINTVLLSIEDEGYEVVVNTLGVK